MGGKTTNTNSTNWGIENTSTSPWSAQTPYILNAFQRAEDAYNQTMKNGPYKGDYIAGDNGQGARAFNQAFEFGTSDANRSFIGNMLSQANSWTNQGSDWMKAGADGLKDLSSDQTDNIISNGNKYAANPYISEAVKAAMIDANRNAAENDVPNLYRSAAGGNNLMSDRAALSQGVVERGLAEKAQGIFAQMRYDALNSGLDRAASEINNRRNTYSTLGDMGARAGQMGVAGIGQGIENQSRLNQMAAAGAEGLRGLRQDALDNDRMKWEAAQNHSWDALSRYYNVIGNKSWGSQGTRTYFGGSQGTTKEDPGLMSTIGGALGVGDALLGGVTKLGTSLGRSGLFSFL